MRAVIQRVSKASVNIDNQELARINEGLVILLGIKVNDSKDEAKLLARKVANMRLFNDENGKMNKSLIEKSGKAIVVSQFTLYGNCKKGRRPSFIEAAEPELAISLYNYFVECLKCENVSVQTGQFQAIMQVEIINEGPVTIILDSDDIQGNKKHC